MKLKLLQLETLSLELKYMLELPVDNFWGEQGKSLDHLILQNIIFFAVCANPIFDECPRKFCFLVQKFLFGLKIVPIGFNWQE
jgi:hypothetical protein